MRRLLVRVDANDRIGWGHLMRCLAIAAAWRDAGGQASFVIRREAASAAAIDRIRSRRHTCFPLVGRNQLADEIRYVRCIAQTIGATWLMLDGYHFTSDYQRQLRSAETHLAVVDDTGHLPRYCGDVLINPSPQAGQIDYQCDAHARKLLGTHFLPLRREVMRWRGNRPGSAKTAARLLVTLGAGDATDHLLKIIEGLSAVRDSELDVQIVAGPSTRRRAELPRAVAHQFSPRFQFVDATDDLPRRMAGADLAISAAGTSLWELAYLGVPAIALIRADNQRPIAEELARRGAALSLGEAGRVSPDAIASAVGRLLNDATARRAMSEAGREAIDGGGAARIVRALLDQEIRLRPAEGADCLTIWHWANDPDTRAASFDSQPIPWDRHQAWFAAETTAADTLFLVARDAEGDPIGQVRFNRHGLTAVTSISVDRQYRGRGYGSRLIRQAALAAFQRWPGIAELEAEVKTSNMRSLRAFERAGFQRQGVVVGRRAGSILLRLLREAST